MVAASSMVLHSSLPEKLFCVQLFAECQHCSQIAEQPGLEGTFKCHLVHALAMGGDIFNKSCNVRPHKWPQPWQLCVSHQD